MANDVVSRSIRGWYSDGNNIAFVNSVVVHSPRGSGESGRLLPRVCGFLIHALQVRPHVLGGEKEDTKTTVGPVDEKGVVCVCVCEGGSSIGFAEVILGW